MSNVNIPGRIVSLVTEDYFSANALAGGVSGDPTTIVPVPGAERVVIHSVHPGPNVPSGWFALAAAFNVGDVVEVYRVSDKGFTVVDENGEVVATSPAAQNGGVRLRKLLDADDGTPTWGVT